MEPEESNPMLDPDHPQVELYRQSLEDLLEFESVNEMAAAYRANEWNPSEEIQHLIHTARYAESEGARLRALEVLRSRRIETLRNNGAIVDASQTTIDETGRVKKVLSTSVVASVLSAGRPANPQPTTSVRRLADDTRPTQSQNENQEQTPPEKEEPPCPTEDSNVRDLEQLSPAIHRKPSRAEDFPGFATNPDAPGGGDAAGDAAGREEGADSGGEECDEKFTEGAEDS